MQTIPCDRLAHTADRSRIRVAGLVITRQRPGTASGVIFLTLEDETGIANLVIWRDTFERFRSTIRLSESLLAEGKIERQGQVVHIHASRVETLGEQADPLRVRSRDFH